MSLQVSLQAPSGPSSDLPRLGGLGSSMEKGPLPAPDPFSRCGGGVHTGRRAPGCSGGAGCSEEVGCEVPGLWGLPCGALGPVPVPRLPGPRRPETPQVPPFPSTASFRPRCTWSCWAVSALEHWKLDQRSPLRPETGSGPQNGGIATWPAQAPEEVSGCDVGWAAHSPTHRPFRPPVGPSALLLCSR